MRVLFVTVLVLSMYVSGYAQTPPFTRIIDFPHGSIITLAWQPGTQNLAIVGSHGISIYNDHGELVDSLTDLNAPITALTWRPDGRALAVHTNALHIWSVDELGRIDTLITTIPTQGISAYAMAYSPSAAWIATASLDDLLTYSDGFYTLHRVRVYDAASSEIVFTSEPTEMGFSDGSDGSLLQWSPDGERLLAFGGDSRHPVIYDTTTWAILAEAAGIDNLVTFGAVPDLSTLFTVSGVFEIYDDSSMHQIEVWEQSEREFVRTRRGTTRGRINAVAVHPTSGLVATANEASDLQTWRLDEAGDLIPVAVLRGHLAPIQRVAWHSQMALLASADADGTILIWNAVEQDYSPPQQLPDRVIELPNGIDWCGTLPDGQYVVCRNGDTFVVVEIESGAIVSTIPDLPEGAYAVQFSADGTRLLVRTPDMLNVYAVRSHAPDIQIDLIDTLALAEPGIHGAAVLSPDGRRVVETSSFIIGPELGLERLATTRVWEVDTETITEQHTGYVNEFVWSPDSIIFMLSLQSFPSTDFWDPANDTPIATYSGISPNCCGGGYGPRSIDWRGSHAAVSTWGLLTLLRVTHTSGTWEVTERHHIRQNVSQVRFSSDGALLAGLSDIYYPDSTDPRLRLQNVMVWDSVSGRPVALFSADIRELFWSGDDVWLVGLSTAPTTGAARLLPWNIESLE